MVQLVKYVSLILILAMKYLNMVCKHRLHKYFLKKPSIMCIVYISMFAEGGGGGGRGKLVGVYALDT